MIPFISWNGHCIMKKMGIFQGKRQGAQCPPEHFWKIHFAKIDLKTKPALFQSFLSQLNCFNLLIFLGDQHSKTFNPSMVNRRLDRAIVSSALFMPKCTDSVVLIHQLR